MSYALSFLYDTIHAQKHALRNCLTLSKDFERELKDAHNAGVLIDDTYVFGVLKKLYDDGAERHGLPEKSANRVLAELSVYLTGSPGEWILPKRREVKPIILPDGYEDMQGLLEAIAPLSNSFKRYILYTPELMKSIRASGFENIEQVYDGFRAFFYPMRPVNKDYKKFRALAISFSKIMHNDPLWWTQDYEECKKKSHGL